MKTKLVSKAGLVVTASLTLGCSSAVGPREDLSLAKLRWSQRGPDSYVMTVGRSCECTPQMTGPVIVTVQNGVVVSRIYRNTGEAVPASHADLFPAVEGLFGRVESELDERAYRIHVDYDHALGFPTVISVDQNKDYVDDEYVISVSSFTEKE